MPDSFVFPGSFDKADPPAFHADDARKFATMRRKLAGKRAEVILRKPKSKRTIDQNAYAHKWPFRLIADAMGEGIEAAKLDILGEKFGWEVSKYSGKPLPIKTSTSQLTTAEFSELIDWMPPWALDKFGTVIPLPAEVM
jgi:hypothetical protein